jgi:drug/metabolite transporter (DMT)-like permease
MLALVASMSLAILGLVFYHLCQKMAPGEAHPLLVLGCAYSVAMVICFTLFWLQSPEKSVLPFLSRSWQTLLLMGGAFVTVELGYLWVYRSGWQVALAGSISTVAAAVILIPTGMTFFQEKVSWINLVGITLCMVGLSLSAQR